jgi:hypothetical protein
LTVTTKGSKLEEKQGCKRRKKGKEGKRGMKAMRAAAKYIFSFPFFPPLTPNVAP